MVMEPPWETQEMCPNRVLDLRVSIFLLRREIRTLCGKQDLLVRVKKRIL
jgi:hypothetical protein